MSSAQSPDEAQQVTTEGDELPLVTVVDDERDVADMYTAYLQDEYRVRTAYGGNEALEVIDDTVDVVLLDRRMPDRPGDEVLSELRSRGLDCQVVMVTAITPDFEIIELRFDAYVTKPASRDELKNAIEQTLRRADFDDQVRELLALSEKQAALEAQMTEEELQSNDRYVWLEERIDELNDLVDRTLGSFDEDVFAGAVQRTQSLAAIRESEERFRSLAEDVLDTARFGTITLDADLEVVWANAQVERYFGLSREDLLGRDYLAVIDEAYGDVFEDGETPNRIRQACEANDGVDSFECRIRSGETGQTIWLEHWSKPIESGLYAGGRLEHYYDITERKQRATTLETLHVATRRMLQFETSDEIGEALVETARDQLGFDHVAYYGWDDVDGLLRPVSATTAFTDHAGKLDAVSGGDGAVWRSFIDEERFTGAVPNEAGSPLDVFEGAFVLPMTTHGVLVIGLPSSNDVPDVDAEFAQLLATNAEAALDRAEREQDLRDRDRELADRNEQLQRLNRINTVIREIDQALVSATSRRAIDEAVCESLVAVDAYSLVWISDVDPVTGELEPRAWAGEESGFLEAAGVTEGAGPAETAIATREQQVILDILESTGFDTWRQEALDRGYRALVSTPVTYEATTYGVLEVYGNRPGAFEPEEQAVLDELGRTIGHAINALQRQEALVAESNVELELELQSLADPFSRLAAALGKTIDLRSVLPQDDDRHLVFFAVSDVASDAVLDAADTVPGLTAVERLQERGASLEFKGRVDRVELVTTVTRHGGTLHSVRATDDETTITVRIPQSTDVRAYVEALGENYPGVELLARREQPTDTPDTGSFYDRIQSRLTERQQEVLRVAYFAGYFEWPRTTDGESVAELLEVAQPTFLQHMRAALRNLLGELYED